MNDPLVARFEVLVEPGTPDWLDVHRRVRSRSRRIWLTAAVAAVFLAIPTVAIALDPTILPWNSAAPASSSVVKSFASMVSGAPPGMDPHAKPGEARTVPLVDGGTVWVAPAANGGFCELFKGPYGGGGCDQTRDFPISDIYGASVSCGGRPPQAPSRVFGHVIAKPGSTLELDFSDGASASLPLTWVGPPIGAGFFEYTSTRDMTALVLRDPHGSLIEKDTKLFAETNRASCKLANSPER
jgi:hypothetical protein